MSDGTVEVEVTVRIAGERVATSTILLPTVPAEVDPSEALVMGMLRQSIAKAAASVAVVDLAKLKALVRRKAK